MQPLSNDTLSHVDEHSAEKLCSFFEKQNPTLQGRPSAFLCQVVSRRASQRRITVTYELNALLHAAALLLALPFTLDRDRVNRRPYRPSTALASAG
jgi:hypothetical protein